MSNRLRLAIAFSIAAAVAALYVAAWAVFDAPGVWVLGRDNLETRIDAPILIGALGVFATVLAIVAGIFEVEAALPRQRVDFEAVPSTTQRLGQITVTLFAICARAPMVHWSVSPTLLLPGGGRLSAAQPIRPDVSLFPGQREEIWQVQSTRDALGDDALIEVEWWSERGHAITRVPVGRLPRFT